MAKLHPSIGLRSASLLVVSVIVGSGVFKKIVPMATELGSPLLIVLCWVVAGFITFAGALSTAEMSGLFPDSGGEYRYFQQVYGRFFAFLYGWGNFTVMKTASIAALAYIFAESFQNLLQVPVLHLGDIFFLQNAHIKLIATGLIILLSGINIRGLTFAEGLSNILTALLIVAVLLFIGFGLCSTKGDTSHLWTASNQPTYAQLSGWSLIKAFFLASLGAFWGYEGWNHIGFIGEEVKQPQKNLPLALGFGTGIVMVLYVGLHLVYCYVLPIDFFIKLAQNPNAIAAVEVARVMGGNWGAILLSCLILLTTLNATNGTILMSARLFYAMGRDGLFFSKAATIHASFHTPAWSMVIQGLWAIGLVWSGSFDALTDMLVFASFIFYGSTALAVILLRKTHPDLPRPYHVLAYPFLPLLFVGFCVILVVMTLINQPQEALFGLGLIASGIPLYGYWKRVG